MGSVQAKGLRAEHLQPGPDVTEPLGANPDKEVILSEVPVKVERIHIDGLRRTKNDIVAKHVQDVFAAENFQEMVARAQTGKAMLERLGLFKTVVINIDVSKGASARPDGYEITFEVQEHRRMTGGVSTLVGTNEGSVVFSVKLPNTLGRGEKLNAQYILGTKKALGYSVDFSKPLQGNPNLNFTSSAYQNSGEIPQSGYKELQRGVVADLGFPTFLGVHSLRWDGVWRELSCLSNTTAFSVREHAGHNLKSALRHTWSRDRRDNPVIPNHGYCIKATQELAGLGGDANYVKHEMEFHAAKSLFWDSSLQLSLAGGLLKTIQPGRNISIQDRFFLGGPLTLRGYDHKGVGPHENGCALGADTYWSAGVHLFTPLPFRPGQGGFGDLFRTHFFLNAGNLRNINFDEEWRENIKKLGETLRWSYGAGVVLRMGGIARLELNYVIPMKAQQGDCVSPGVQFGIGIQFL